MLSPTGFSVAQGPPRTLRCFCEEGWPPPVSGSPPSPSGGHLPPSHLSALKTTEEMEALSLLHILLVVGEPRT